MTDVAISDAEISADGRYRYSLTRRWGPGPQMLWVMLNPSTADVTTNDNTIRRCIGYAKREQCDAIRVVNLFALRNRNPKVIIADPYSAVGPGNVEYLRDAFARAAVAGEMIVAGWGCTVSPQIALSLLPTLDGQFLTMMCLGQTRDGSPRHPLYLSVDQPFEVWPPSTRGRS